MRSLLHCQIALLLLHGLPAFCIDASNCEASGSAQAAAVVYPTSAVVNANVDRTIGGTHDVGSVILTVLPDGSWLERWSFPSGSYSLLAGAPNSNRLCSKTASDGSTAVVTVPDCQRAVPWFAPWIGPQLSAKHMLGARPTSDSSTQAGSGTGNAVIYRYVALPGTSASQTPVSQDQSAVLITFGSDNITPVTASFSGVSTPGSATVVPTEQYSDYGNEGGFSLPHTLVRTSQAGTLTVHVTAITVH